MTDTRFGRLRWLAAAGLLALTSAPAWAGPPLVTDDPVPTAWKHWEIVTPLTLESADGDHVFQTPGLDMNYGGGKNLQLTLGTGLEWSDPATGNSPRWSDLELAAKYRFVSWGGTEHHTQIAFFPRIIVPGSETWNTVTWSSVDRRWPVVWLHELGPSTRVYGEVHVTTLHEPSERSPWFAGIAIERDANEQWMLTGEAFWQEAESAAVSDARGFNVGVVRKLVASKSDEDSGIDLLFAGGWTSDSDLVLYFGPRFGFRGLGR